MVCTALYDGAVPCDVPHDEQTVQKSISSVINKQHFFTQSPPNISDEPRKGSMQQKSSAARHCGVKTLK